LLVTCFFLSSSLLPICLNLHNTAGILPSTLLFAPIQETWNHDHQQQHHSTSAGGSSKSAPETTTTIRPRGGPDFFLSISRILFISPMTCVETQTVGLHQLDNMAGLQKHPRTKAATARYIVFYHVFLNFASFENVMLSESNVFLFFAQPTSPDSLDTSPFSQVPPQLFVAPQRFSFSCCQVTPCQCSIM